MNDSAANNSFTTLPSLPLDAWSDTKLTLHLYFQIVGKIRLVLTPPQNHWWHVPLYITARGVTSSLIPVGSGAFSIDFDFVDHRLQVNLSDGRRDGFALTGQSVAEFHDQLFIILRKFGIDVQIVARPFDLEGLPPFPKDSVHASYDREYVNRFWQTMIFAQSTLYEFGGRFLGKKTPVHMFWHSFDLALTFFSGKAVPPREGAGVVEREAYSHEVISFGYWAGDQRYPAPAFYSYTFPEPKGLREQPLRPDVAKWVEQNGGSLAVLPYQEIRTSKNPQEEVLNFLESAYRAGGMLSGWEMETLRYTPPR